MNEEERIQEIKRLKEEIARLESTLIDFELPKNYDKMSEEEKKAYQKRQQENIEMALSDIENYDIIKNYNVKFSYPKTKSIVYDFARQMKNFKPLPIIRNEFRKTYPEDVKKNHKKQLEEIESLIDRYNSTKVMRNDRIEFGVNFLTFIKTYLTEQATNTLNRLVNKKFLTGFSRQKDKNGNPLEKDFKIQDLTDEQRKALIKIRIKSFADKLNFLHNIAQKKIRKDNAKNAETFMQSHGFMQTNDQYRDGTKKFTSVSSSINKKDMAKFKNKKSHINDVSVGHADENKYSKAQHELIEFNVMREKFDKFVKNYRGNGRQFSVEFSQNFPVLAKLVYGKNDDSVDFIHQNLASSPISVQEHEISKRIEEEIKKINFRMQYSSDFIPAGTSKSYAFLGKVLTNEKTQTEKNLDALKVAEYQKQLKNMSVKQDLVGYDAILGDLSLTLQKGFKVFVSKQIPNFEKLPEAKKIEELKKFINSQIQKTQISVHKNKFFSSGVDKLLNLNGIYIHKKTRTSSNNISDLMAGLSVEEAEKYRIIVQDLNDANIRYSQEKNIIEELGNSVDDREEDDLFDDSKFQDTMDKINDHSKKLLVIKTTIDSLEEKKKEIEKKFASKQIDEAIKTNKNLSYNTSKSVFDKYRFPAVDAFGESYDIEVGSIEAKQIEKLISNFIMKFKNQVQNMKVSFDDKKYPEIFDYISRLSSKLSDDFGTNIRDLKKTQKFFKSQIENLQQTKQNKVVEELDNYLQRLNRIESELIKKLKSMNVEIGNVTLLKK